MQSVRRNRQTYFSYFNAKADLSLENANLLFESANRNLITVESSYYSTGKRNDIVKKQLAATKKLVRVARSSWPLRAAEVVRTKENAFDPLQIQAEN